MTNVEIIVKFQTLMRTGELKPKNQPYGLDYWIESNSVNTQPFTSDYYNVGNELVSERVFPRYITPNLTEINYKIRKGHEHEVLTRMVKLVGVTDLWTLVEYAIDRLHDPEDYKVSFRQPAWHHLVMDIQNARLGVNVPSFVSIEPERSKWVNKRGYLNRLFRSSMIGKGGIIPLFTSDLEANYLMMKEEEQEATKKVLSKVRIVTNRENNGIELDYKSFSSAEDFIEFQQVFTKLFLR